MGSALEWRKDQAIAMSEQYEFTDGENATIKASGKRAGLWGILSIVIGALQILVASYALSTSGGFTASVMLAGGAVGVVVGATFVGVGTALENVVRTRGNDVTLMMGALRKLASALTIQIVATVVGFVVGLIAGASGVRP